MNKKTLMLAICLWTFIGIPLFQTGIISYLFYAINAYIVIIWAIRYSRVILTNLHNPIFLLIVIYEIWIVIVSTINLTISFGILYSCVAVPVIISVIVKERDYFLDAMYRMYALVTVVNLLSMVIFGKWISQYSHLACCILGGKNALSKILVPGLIVFMLKWVSRRDWKSMALILITCLQLVLSSSSTAVIITIICLVGMFFVKSRFIYKKMPFFLVAGEVFLIYFLSSSEGVINSIIQTLFRKNYTLAGRTYIWERALELIAENPFIGYGRGANVTVDIDYFGTNYYFSELHNAILQVMFNGGWIAIIIYSLILVCLYKICIKNRSINGNILAIGMACCFIAGMTESVQDAITIWMVYGMVMSCPIINENASVINIRSVEEGRNEGEKEISRYNVRTEVVAKSI